MAPSISGNESLRPWFAALTEHTFQVDLGVTNPRLIDYVVDMLIRFVNMDAIYTVRDATGRRLEEVAEMLLEAEQRVAKPRREIYRHIGDFTLFWTGVFPEAISRRNGPSRKDHLIDFCEQGKRSYYIASTFDDEPYQEEAPVLRQLSHEFELCTVGLNRVRKEWEQAARSRRSAEEN